MPSKIIIIDEARESALADYLVEIPDSVLLPFDQAQGVK